MSSEGGRVLYGGGGITPDLPVGPVTLETEEEEAVRSIYAVGGGFNVALFNHAVRFVQDRPELAVGFRLTDADLDEFFQALPEWDVAVDASDFRRARRFIRYQMEREIALQAWGEAEQFQQTLRHDAPLARALELLREAESMEELLELAGGAVREGAGA
jgi:carboxyl-terminal processing protease